MSLLTSSVLTSVLIPVNALALEPALGWAGAQLALEPALGRASAEVNLDASPNILHLLYQITAIITRL